MGNKAEEIVLEEPTVEEILNAKRDRIPKVDLPPGQSGDWTLSHFELTEEDIAMHNLRCSIGAYGMRGREMKPGRYTQLLCNGQMVMSDTPAEIRDHLDAVIYAKDHCLISGLGLGMIAVACLQKPSVTKVTVIEKSADVIKLVAPTLLARYGERLEIIHADIFDWKPPKGEHYGMVWNDIWDEICTDNWPQMKRLRRKFCRRADWIGHWCEESCRN